MRTRLTATCTRTPVSSTCRACPIRVRVASARRPDSTQKIAATAPNDSQKPGALTAHGSSAQTTAAAAAKLVIAAGRVRRTKAKPTTASMKKVRCAGTAHPASKAYAPALSTAASAAADCAGIRASSARERLQSAAVTAATSPASMVMCSPEIATR